MTLSSLHLDLTQCTGVANVGRLPGPASPTNKFTANAAWNSLEGSQAAQAADQRQPLHEHNSQTHSSSQKRSPNTSESIVVTPAEKRQTVLVLSPERPLCPGDRYDTLEIQRALSLSARSRRSLRGVCDKPSSLDGLPDQSLTSSLAKVQASPSQQPHKATAQRGSQGSAEHQPAFDNQLVINPVSSHEPHTVDIPPTQLDCAAATALDLLQCEATQLISFAPACSSPHRHTNAVCTITATDASAPLDNAVILLMPQGKGISLSDTPVLLPAAQLQPPPQAGDATIGSEALCRHALSPNAAQMGGNAHLAQHDQYAPTDKQQENAHSKAQKQHIQQPAVAAAETATAAATLSAPLNYQESRALPPTASAAKNQADSDIRPQPKPASCGAKHNIAASDKQEPVNMAEASAAAGVASGLQTADGSSQPIRLPLSLEAADMALQDTETSSQDWIVSLEGTQAEADAFIEQCARLVLNSTTDQDNEELPWAVAVMEISKSTLDVVALHALDIPFLTWRGTQEYIVADRLIWTGRFRFEHIDITLGSSKDASGDSWDPGCIQEYLCSPVEVQRRAATFAVRGELHDEVPSSSSMSHVGSLAATWGSTQDTQCGTAGQQASAAAAIMLSQMLDEDHAVPQQPADIAAAHPQTHGPENAAAAEQTKHEGQENAKAQMEQPAVEVHLSSAACHGLAVIPQQTNALLEVPATEVQQAEPTELQDSDVMRHRIARPKAEHQATKAQPSAQCLDMQEEAAMQVEWRQRRQLLHKEDKQLQAIQPTNSDPHAEQQHTMETHIVTAPILQSTAARSAQQAQHAGTPTHAAAAAHIADEGKPEQQPAADIAKLPVPAEAAMPSPTQHLRLQLTCQDISSGGKRTVNSTASDAATEKAAGDVSDADTDVANASAAKDSPRQLQLGLDTQLPSPVAVTASKAPIGVLGWLGGGWSVPQGPDAVAELLLHGSSSQIDSQQLPDFTCHAAGKHEAIGAGTEVTPSGVRPPRGLTATPKRKAANSFETNTSPHGTPTPNGLGKPPATGHRLAHVIHDSEEAPLVLPRPHGPPHKSFADAHILPCSSPLEEEEAHGHAGHSPDGNAADVLNIKMSALGKNIPQAGAKAPGVAEGPAQQAVKPGSSKRTTKKRSARKARPTPKGPTGMPYRAALPAPRYQSQPSKPPSSAPRSKTAVQPAAQQQPNKALQTPAAAPNRPSSKQMAQATAALPKGESSKHAMQTSAAVPFLAGKELVVMHSMCTLEQLPVGCGTSPNCLSPRQGASLVVLPDVLRRQGQDIGQQQGQGTGQKQGQGTLQEQREKRSEGQEAFGPGMLGRSAAAALCSARCQLQEPRDAYSFPDSDISDPNEYDGEHEKGQATASRQQASCNAEHQPLPHSSMHRGQQGLRATGAEAVASAPPQQSRRQWQTKPTGKSGVEQQHHTTAAQQQTGSPALPRPSSAARKRQRGNCSIARNRPARKRQPPPRWDDTVGHSQLESEVLNAADPDSPTPPLAPVSPPDLHTDPERISPGEALGSDSDEDDRPANLASAAAAVISGRGKRRQVGSANGATKDAARAPARRASPDAKAMPAQAQAGKHSVKIPSLGCTKCRYAPKGCRKCRAERQSALQAAGLSEDGREDSTALEPKSRGKNTLLQHPSPCLHAQQKDAEHLVPGQREGSSTCRASLQAPDADEQQGQYDSPKGLKGSRRRASGPVFGAAQLQQPTAGQGTSKQRVSAAAEARDLQPATRHNTARQSLPGMPLNRDQPDTPSALPPHTTVGSPAVDVDGSPAAAAQGRAAKRQRRASFGATGHLPLAPYSFLLTGFGETKQSKALQAKIVHLGGYLEDTLPTYQERQRASMGSKHSNQILVIPAAAQPQRTAKYIYAKIRGVPIVTEQWVHACATSHRLMPLHCQKHSKEVVRGASEAHEVFKGCRIFLAGPDASVGDLADLVQHAGGQLVKALEEYPAPRSRGSPDALQQPCDCIISVCHNAADDQQGQRLARRLRVPIKDRMWAMNGFDSGSLQPPITPAEAPSPPPTSPPTRLQPGLTDRPQARQPQTTRQTRLQASRDANAVHMNQGNGFEANRGTSRGKRKRVELVIPESEQQYDREDWPAGPSADSAGQNKQQQHCRRTARHKQRGTKGSHGARQDRKSYRRVSQGGMNDDDDDSEHRDEGVIEDSIEDDNSPMCSPDMDDISSADLAQQQLSDRGKQKQSAAGSTEAGQLLSGEVEWVGNPSGPPEGSGLTPSEHRTYFGAFKRGLAKITLGDFLELAPLPGDKLTRLVRLTALWSEPSQKGQRMLARCQRFYRPEETPLPNRFQANEVFSSLDVEDKVSLQAVLCKCNITASDAQCHVKTGNHRYVCGFDYDSNSVQLSMSWAL